MTVFYSACERTAMELQRRAMLGLWGVGLVTTGGCMGLLEDVTTHRSTEATVASEAHDQAGFEHVRTEELVEEREFAGQTVEVTNFVSEYSRTIGVAGPLAAETAIFAALTSPQVSVAGRDFNPLDGMSNRDIAEFVQEHYEDFSVDDRIAERSVSTLGTEVTVETFSGSATVVGGQEAPVRPEVGRLEHAGDHVIVLGVYPDSPGGLSAYDPTGEQARITTMIEGIQHGSADSE
ncbi:MAG: DUF6517 family protein [Natrialbaceae archaeon]|nr:DUF6517 family protein [Natrialbaceae archaeon]